MQLPKRTQGQGQGTRGAAGRRPSRDVRWGGPASSCLTEVQVSEVRAPRREGCPVKTGARGAEEDPSWLQFTKHAFVARTPDSDRNRLSTLFKGQPASSVTEGMHSTSVVTLPFPALFPANMSAPLPASRMSLGISGVFSFVTGKVSSLFFHEYLGIR